MQYLRDTVYMGVYTYSLDIFLCVQQYVCDIVVCVYIRVCSARCIITYIVLYHIYFAKETYDFKEPTDRSHPISNVGGAEMT